MNTVSGILSLIDPVDPDNLKPVGVGKYEALWSPASPHLMDIEILRRTEGIEWVGKPYTPPHLPTWTAVQFTVERAFA